MESTKACKCKEHHFIHICQLNSDAESELIELLTNNPKVKCEHCGEEANSSSYVCMPIVISPQVNLPGSEQFPANNRYVRKKTNN